MDSVPSLARGRFYIVLAAILWSTGGAFTKILTQDTFVGVNEPPVDSLAIDAYHVPVQIACYRALFAGLFLVPTLRRRDLSFRPVMIWMGLSFAAMNALFVTAMALGPSANAILLQYSAPLWMYLAAVFLLGEPSDRRGTITLAIGLGGIAVIVLGGWQTGDLTIIAIALGSGFTYAGVLIGLRVLRQESSNWLTVWNHLLGGLILVPLLISLRPPTPGQFAVLFFYGSLQMGLPYWLVARGLRVVSPQEAGTITLLEPILNPVWAYLVSPRTEVPGPFTYLGGAMILGALAWRYWPRRARNFLL
ncbi:MAG TPA: DMT family transporter [Gemmataceae bacterium]|nr:DMT family transporter [Gemmataceae bacterium]